MTTIDPSDLTVDGGGVLYQPLSSMDLIFHHYVYIISVHDMAESLHGFN